MKCFEEQLNNFEVSLKIFQRAFSKIFRQNFLETYQDFFRFEMKTLFKSFPEIFNTISENFSVYFKNAFGKNRQIFCDIFEEHLLKISKKKYIESILKILRNLWKILRKL